MTNNNKYICFSLEKDQFAIPLLQVKEVIGDVKITPIPDRPSYFKGIINLRGQVLSIIDLKDKMRLKTSTSQKSRTIIILDFESAHIGVLVDSVDCVSTYDEGDLDNVHVINGMNTSEGVQNVAKKENGLVPILDLGIILGVMKARAA